MPDNLRLQEHFDPFVRGDLEDEPVHILLDRHHPRWCGAAAGPSHLNSYLFQSGKPQRPAAPGSRPRSSPPPRPRSPGPLAPPAAAFRPGVSSCAPGPPRPGSVLWPWPWPRPGRRLCTQAASLRILTISIRYLLKPALTKASRSLGSWIQGVLAATTTRSICWAAASRANCSRPAGVAIQGLFHRQGRQPAGWPRRFDLGQIHQVGQIRPPAAEKDPHPA